MKERRIVGERSRVEQSGAKTNGEEQRGAGRSGGYQGEADRLEYNSGLAFPVEDISLRRQYKRSVLC